MSRLIWYNSTRSGLCDRLIDLFMVAAMSELYEKPLYLCWHEQQVDDIQKQIWNKIRFNDYKIENVMEYFEFPDCIHIIPERELQTMERDGDSCFRNYLGGMFSPVTFYKAFISKSYSWKDYLDKYNNVLKEFKPKDKLLQLVKEIPQNMVSVHLRRTDKSSLLVGGSHGVPVDKMDFLNKTTKDILNQLIKNGNTNIYFASDCPVTKAEYEKEYSQYNPLQFNNNITQDIEQTYIDIYVMSMSKYIVLSQKYSSFSLFASLINKVNFIYIYNEDIILDNDYHVLDNIVFYRDLERIL